MRSLFSRLFSAQLAVVLIALITVGLSLSYMYTQYIFDTKEQELIRVGQRVASQLGGPSVGMRVARIQALLEAAHVYGDASIWVVNPDGVVLVTSAPQGAEQGIRLEQSDVERLLSGKIVSKRAFLEQLAEPAFSVAVPVNTPWGVSGAVVLHAPLRGIMSTISDGRQLIFWAGVLATGLAAFISLLLARRVAGPLQEMRSIALDMAKGDFSRRVKVTKRGDEVDELATALNDMALRLDSTMRALDEENRKTDSSIAGLAEGVLAVDNSYQILIINDAAQQWLHPFAFAAGDSLPPQGEEGTLLDTLVSTMREVLTERIAVQFMVEESGRSLSVKVNPVVGSDGQLIGAVALLQDISERQRLEKMRRDFVADVSHELRTPLTSICGFAQAILDDVVTTDEQKRRYLGIIMDESLRLTRLTNTLIDLSRMESHKASLRLEHLVLADVASDALAFLEPHLVEKGVSVHTQIAADLPLVMADPDRLEQVLLNLLDNAVRHAPQNGHVELAARPWPESAPLPTQVLITVTDNGPGIPEEELPFIWERFYKVDKARKQHRTGGTGLGLVIVKQLIEMHGGNVWADNVPTGGARFWVTLPVAAG